MALKKATRRSGNCGRASGLNETKSIVANAELFRTAIMSTLFVVVMLAAPTAMAVLKQWGCW